MKKQRCSMSVNKKCNSDYGKKIRCDGYKIPKECPYNFLREMKDIKI